MVWLVVVVVDGDGDEDINFTNKTKYISDTYE